MARQMTLGAWLWIRWNRPYLGPGVLRKEKYREAEQGKEDQTWNEVASNLRLLRLVDCPRSK